MRLWHVLYKGILKYNTIVSFGTKVWRAKECDKTPLRNVNKEKSHFSS